MYLYEFDDVNELLYKTLKNIIDNGRNVCPRSELTKEIIGYSFILNNPRARCITIESRKWKVKYALGELIWNLKGSINVDEIAFYSKAWLNFSEDNNVITGSCYGNKIFNEKKIFEELSQWDSLIKLLKEDPDSRRAVLYIGNNSYFGLDQPCISTIQFLIRDGKLNCICNMRSNDAIWGTCYDVFLVTFLQEMLSLELDVDMGWYMHHANSMHLYEKHFEMVKKILDEYETKKTLNTCFMEKMTKAKDLKKIFEFEEDYRKEGIVNMDILNGLDTYWSSICKTLISGKISDLFI